MPGVDTQLFERSQEVPLISLPLKAVLQFQQLVLCQERHLVCQPELPLLLGLLYLLEHLMQQLFRIMQELPHLV